MIFLNSASSAEVLVFDLPLCTHTTDTEGKPREARVQNIYIKIFEKMQYLMKTLYLENVKAASNQKMRPAFLSLIFLSIWVSC